MKGRRIVLALFTTPLWLVAGVLLLEVWLTVVDRRAEHDSRDLWETHAPRAPGMVRAEKVQAVETAPPVDANTPRTVAPPVLTRMTEGKAAPRFEEDPLARYQFLTQELSFEACEGYAALHGEFWFHFDQGGNLLEAFGEPELASILLGGSRFFQQELTEERCRLHFSNLVEGGQEHRTLPLSTPNAIDAHWISTADGTQLLAFRDAYGDSSIERLQTWPEQASDSRWLVPMLGYKPNISDGMFVTDQLGFRTVPVEIPRPEAAFRVLCFGGSTTEQGPVGTARTTEYLRDELQRQFPDTIVEVVNAGMSGSATNSMRRRSRDFLRYEPQLLVYYGGVNDMVGYLTLWHAHADIDTWQWLAYRSQVVNRWGWRWFLPDSESMEAYLRRVTLTNLRAIKIAAEQQGRRLIVCSFAYPDPELLTRRQRAYLDSNFRRVWHGRVGGYHSLVEYYEQLNQLLREFCEQEDIFYVPVQEEMPASFEHFIDVCHMTPAGRAERGEILARHLAPFVEEFRSERAGAAVDD